MDATYEENGRESQTRNRPDAGRLPERVGALIVGGGISGLAALHALRKGGIDAFLVEGSGQVGGTIRTVEAPWGGRLDMGPATLRGKAEELNRLISEIGLDDEVVETHPSARSRFVLRRGRPVAVPSSPKSAIETELISLGGKLRAVAERFVRGGDGREDESVAEFFRRRFGREVLDYGVDPFVAGIYAGDPERLSMAQTFPSLLEMEREFGSLIRGGMAKMKERGNDAPPSRRPYSFRNGLSRLPERLAELYPDSIALSTPAMKITQQSDGWNLTTGRGGITADRLILATNAEMAADLIRSFDPVGADLLDEIESSPVAILQLLYDEAAFAQKPEGFGMLVPAVEQRNILGVIYTSSIFPDRVEEGKVLLTVFIGGARRPELTERSGSELTGIASAEIAGIYGTTADPIDSIYQLWRPGIPQYTVGYERILEGIDLIEDRHPGLTFLGSYRGGVSVPERVAAGMTIGSGVTE